jgi:hypothetical protein
MKAETSWLGYIYWTTSFQVEEGATRWILDHYRRFSTGRNVQWYCMSTHSKLPLIMYIFLSANHQASTRFHWLSFPTVFWRYRFWQWYVSLRLVIIVARFLCAPQSRFPSDKQLATEGSEYMTLCIYSIYMSSFCSSLHLSSYENSPHHCVNYRYCGCAGI